MCLILIAIEQHVKYPLIILVNRDELYSRPTLALHAWHHYPIVAPMDLLKKGTWFGMNKSGAWAGVTTYRSGKVADTALRSRGLLVTDYLQGDFTPLEYVTCLQATANQYNDFNLLFGHKHEVFYYSSRLNQFSKVEPGIHALSNAELNTPWPKVIKGKTQLKSQLMDSQNLDKTALLHIMTDRSLADDHLLPITGIDFAREKKNSAMWVTGNLEGTCSTDLLLLDRENNIDFTETIYQGEDKESLKVEIKFELTA